MKYLKYFESYNRDEYYIRLPHTSVDDVVFDEFLDITSNALAFTNEEIEFIVNNFKNFKFIEKYPEILFRIGTKSRDQLGGAGDDIVQVCINIENNLSTMTMDLDLSLMIYKVSDDWYYVATFGGDGDYKCDQIEGLLKFFEDLPKITDVYKSIGKLDESISDISIKEKLESIVTMCDYLWSIDTADSLNGFYGKCSALFTGCLDVNRGWSSGGLKPYEFNIDCLVDKLQTSEYRRQEKLESVEELYKLSLVKRFNHTKEEIEEILEPVFNFKLIGYKVISSFRISQHYSWVKRPTFTISVTIDEEELQYDKDQISQFFNEREWNKESKNTINQLNKEFYRLTTLISGLVKNLDLKSHGLEYESCGNNTHLGNFSEFSFFLKEV
jgi:hypothetical protein